MKSLKLLAAILFTFLSLQAFSQFEATTQADVIVEGEVTSVSAKWKNDRSHIVTETYVKVKSIFKGDITDSLLRIETFGGEVEGDFHFSPHTINLQKGYEGYFFLNNNSSFIDNQNGFAYLKNGLNKKVRMKGQIYNVQTFEENIIKTTKFPKLTSSEYFNFIKNKEKRDKDTCNIISSFRTNKSIEFSFKNVKYNNNFQFLEFDIKAKVNTPGLKFGKGNLYINYSKHFGTNLISENTLELTKGTIIQHSLYNLSTTDYDTQTIKISILPQYGSNLLYTFSESEEDLVHVKLKITDYTSIGSISFEDIDISGEVYYWCQGSFELFDETNLSEPITSTGGTQGNTVGITYTFENVSYNTTFNQLSIDLFASTTSSSLYSTGELYIDYNSDGFLPFAVAAENVSFTFLGGVLDNGNYLPTLTDFDNNTLSLLIFSLQENNFATLNTNPQKLGRFTFKVISSNCNEQKGIAFDVGTIFGLHTHYTGQMPIPHEDYIPVVADDEENGTICGCDKPLITSFTPTTIHGGVGEILTITGQNFGNFVPSTSTVLFKNGDDSGPNEIEAGSSDFRWDNIIHWTDTEIKIEVPGCDKNSGTGQPPATGKFKVKNSCESSEESSTKLDIPYSILNYRGSTNAETGRLNLQSNSPNNSICFQFSNQVPNWIRDQFNIAISEWCSATGINFGLGATINSNTPQGFADNVNLVSFESGSGGLMRTNSFYFQNNDCASSGKYFNEIDFTLKTSLSIPTQQDEENMREIIKHELGHAHMLQHAKGFGQLMHPNGNSGGVITSNDQTGANLVFSSSSACGGNPIGSGSCGVSCSTNAVESVEQLNISIFPNPVYDLLTIINQFDNIYEISIYDLKGKLINQTKHANSVVDVDVCNLPSGLYVCKISTNIGILNKLFSKL